MVAPEALRPNPKVQVIKFQIGVAVQGKEEKGKSRILTDTPEKLIIESEN